MADIDNLRAFAAAAETGSFSAAARKLGKAQSAISSSIANLELDLDVVLFDRSGYRSELSEVGHSVLRHAQYVIESMEAFENRANVLSTGIEAYLSICIEDGLFNCKVQQQLASLLQAFPSLDLRIEQKPRRKVLADLERNAVDFILVTGSERLSNTYLKRGLGFQRLVPVCHSDFALSQQHEVHRQELNGLCQIVGPPHDNAPSTHRILSPHTITSESLHTRLSLVLAKMGWSELPVDLVEQHVLDGSLRVLEFAFEQNSILDTVGLITAPKTNVGPALQWLTSEILKWDQRVWIGNHIVGRRRFGETR